MRVSTMSKKKSLCWIALAALAGCSPAPTMTGYARLPAEELIDTISHGEPVDIADHVEEGKLTVFEFTAKW